MGTAFQPDFRVGGRTGRIIKRVKWASNAAERGQATKEAPWRSRHEKKRPRPSFFGEALLTRIAHLAKVTSISCRSKVQMDMKRLAKYEARARIIKALAHPARLLIVDELSTAGERCVCELTEMIGSDMSTVSRHLTVLKGAGLVEDEKRGQMVFYRLRVKCILKFFDCVESVIECNARSQQELLA